MNSNKLILTQKTSVSDVAKFFKTQDLTMKKFRARDLGDGRIEIYVRKDSFEQFFTDKLRLGVLVERDYQKAKNHILNIIKKSDPAGENSSAFAGIKEGLDAHRQNFYSGEFSNHLNNALYRNEKLSLAKEILKLDRSTVNSLSAIGQTVNSPDVQQEISTVLQAIKDPGDKEIFQRNFDALGAVMKMPVPNYQAELTTIDYNCAIDFFRVWLKEIKNMEGSKLNSATAQKLTAFAEDVVRKGVPERIDLNGGNFIDSDADLIIFDDLVGCESFRFSLSDNSERDDVQFGDNNNAITTITFSEKHISDKKDLTAGFRVCCASGQEINQTFMELLYDQIESAFKKKMLQNPTSSPKLTTEGNRAEPTYTIHLPVMNPFVSQDLTRAQSAMIQKSFAKATKKWVDQYPNLRIKVNLAGNIKLSSIEAHYRKIDKAQRLN